MTTPADPAAAAVHPVAIEHLPMFITPPGDTDVLMVVTAVVLLAAVVGFGVFFLRLHSLPEHLAHKGDKMQAEIVAVLCLISLFTHMHIFWIIGLVLAMIELPDFGGPLNRIAGSTEKLAGFKPGEGDVDTPRFGGPFPNTVAEHAEAPHAAGTTVKQSDAIPLVARDAIPLVARQAVLPKHKGRAHA
jgi:hypothetical protein